MKYSSSLIVRTNNVQRYFKDISSPKYNPLDDSVIRKMFDDRKKYRSEIINAHIRLVATIAKTYDNDDKFMDYNQEGIEGLIEAFEKYDPKQISKFSSYAAFWIRAKMSMLCKDLNMIQRSNQSKIGSKVIKFQEQFLKENMREATQTEIIEHLSKNCDIDIHYENEIFGVTMVDINQDLNDDDNRTIESCGEFAVKTSSQNGYIEQIEKEDLSNDVRKLMKTLNNKERDFITRHIFNAESYDDIAEDVGCTAERVRQIVVGGLRKMKGCDFAKTRFACYLK
jgi:RNA polymerase sigma factor (sigma-70 family)